MHRPDRHRRPNSVLEAFLNHRRAGQAPPLRKCRVPGQVVEFPSGEGDRHHGRDQSKADKRSGKVDVVCRPASKAFCPTHGVCRYPGRRLETPGGRAFRQVKRSGSRCQTSDGGCRRRTENPPPLGVRSVNTRGGSITWLLIRSSPRAWRSSDRVDTRPPAGPECDLESPEPGRALAVAVMTIPVLIRGLGTDFVHRPDRHRRPNSVARGFSESSAGRASSTLTRPPSSWSPRAGSFPGGVGSSSPYSPPRYL